MPYNYLIVTGVFTLIDFRYSLTIYYLFIFACTKIGVTDFPLLPQTKKNIQKESILKYKMFESTSTGISKEYPTHNFTAFAPPLITINIKIEINNKHTSMNVGAKFGAKQSFKKTYSPF